MTYEKQTDTGRKNRDFGADVVRITALFMVLMIHYFLRNGFYYREAAGFFGFTALMLRSATLCCVPLFMMLTGYLKCGKPWNPAYYRSILPILFSYLMISLIHLPYRILIRGEQASAGEWVLRFFHFKLAEYGWYVGMYIGLFLASPLLNLMWQACSSRKKHLAAVLTLAALTFLPSSVNQTQYGNLLPAYFQGVYYVSYYLIGCYIRTWKPKPRRHLCVIFVLIPTFALAFLNLATRTEADNFYSGFHGGYNSILTALMTTSLFLLLYQCRCRKEKLRRCAAHFSGVVFEIYLLSYIADTNIYPLFYKQYSMGLYLPVGIVMILAVFILTYPAAFFVNRLSKRLAARLFM